MTTQRQHDPFGWSWSRDTASPKGRVWIRVPVLLALVLATLGTMLFAPLGVINSAGCEAADEALICTSRGQSLVVWIPWVSGPVLGALGGLGIASRKRLVRYLAPLGWILGLVAVWVTVIRIADTHPVS
ncbi:hypothetical protein [Yinghuangia soli]|uniref:Transmembrane protein n=1 Tax=Yinghuangia soli TaxID=2908204 RepID=A0AA41Q6Q3_9ACTN|nr:hypothetical protein [Yinghuangia soli]MCF2531207.1 hypothetical protein [Yinghuangia soli]